MTALGIAPGQASFAIGGSALLFPYYLGLLHTLHETGYVIPGNTSVAGISGGALTTSATCAGLAPSFIYKHLTAAIEQHISDVWVVRESLIRELGSYARKGSHKRCRGKVHIAMSQLHKDSSTLNGSTEYIVSRFTSDDDFWGAVVGSSTLACAGYTPSDPGAAGMSYYKYRNRGVMDGAYANNLTSLCNAMGLEYGTPNTTCVSVYTYVPGYFRRYDESSAADVVKTGPSETTTPAKKTKGWNLPTNCTYLNEKNKLPPFEDAFDVKGVWPTIFPGCDPRNPLPFTLKEWQDMALNATTAFPNLETMYKLGKKDGDLWVRNQTAGASGNGGRRRLGTA